MGNLYKINFLPPYVIAEREEGLLRNFEEFKRNFFDKYPEGIWANQDGEQLENFYQFLEAAASKKPYVLLGDVNRYVGGYSLTKEDTLELDLAKLHSIMQTWNERRESGLLTNRQGNKARPLKTLMDLFKE